MQSLESALVGAGARDKCVTLSATASGERARSLLPNAGIGRCFVARAKSKLLSMTDGRSRDEARTGLAVGVP